MAEPKVLGRILLMPKGDYSASTTYNSLDWVRDGGKAWVCKVDGTKGVKPVEGAKWTLLSENGIDGTNGTNGVGISSVVPTKTGKTTTVTITLTNGTTTSFAITDGADGTGGGDMYQTTYDTDKDGIVDFAENVAVKNADGSVKEGNPATLVELGEDATTGNLTYKGNPISGGSSSEFITSVNTEQFTVSSKKLNLHSNVTTKLSKLDKIDTDTTATSGQALAWNGTVYTPTTIQSGISPSDMLSTVSAVENNTTSGKVVDALVVKTFSNLYKDRITIENIPIGTTYLGTWCNNETWTTSDTADWLGATNSAQDLIIKELLTVADNDEDLEFQFMFEVDGNEPIYLGGYQWDSTLGRMCIKFGQALTKVGKIAIDVIRTRG